MERKNHPPDYLYNRWVCCCIFISLPEKGINHEGKNCEL